MGAAMSDRTLDALIDALQACREAGLAVPDDRDVASALAAALAADSICWATTVLATSTTACRVWPENGCDEQAAAMTARYGRDHALVRHYLSGGSGVHTARQLDGRWQHSWARSWMVETFGVHEQAALPVRGPSGTCNVLSIGRDGRDFDEAELARARTVQHLFRLGGVTGPFMLPASVAQGQPTHAVPRQATLTAREREVLAAVATGRSRHCLARALNVRERTLDKHLENAYRKLGVSSLPAALFAAGLTVTAAPSESPSAPPSAPPPVGRQRVHQASGPDSRHRGSDRAVVAQ